MRTFIALCAVLLLSGCASQRAAQAEKDKAAAAMFCAQQAGPFRGGLAVQAAFETDDIGVTQMTAPGSPSPTEREALPAYAQANDRCMDAETAWLGTYNPALAPAASRMKSAKDEVWADLIMGKVSYAQANREFQQISDKTKAEMGQLAQSQAILQAQQEAASAAQSANVMAAFANAAQSLSPPPPAITPMQIPTMQQCRTVFTGNVANTQCF